MENWEQLLVSPHTKIIDAIHILDKCGKRLILISNEAKQLLGTVTDGDVRRALIKQISLENPVSEIMCKEPKFVKIGWMPELIKTTMKQFDLLHIPIVDNDKKLVGLQTLQEVLEEKRFENPVLLIAGGFGKRLHPLTENCPKPLLKVGDKPILELILARLAQQGFYKFYISTHFLHTMINDYFGDGSKWGVNIKYIHEDKPLGTGGALGLLPKEDINLPLLMMNADLLTAINLESLLSFHQLQGGVASLCVREYCHNIPYGVVNGQGHELASIVEKPVHRFFINAGIYVLNPELLEQITPDIPLDMPTFLQTQLGQGKKVCMFPLHEYWLDIGRIDDFNKAQEVVF